MPLARVLALLILLAPAAHAQAAGRWAILLRGGPAGLIRGELNFPADASAAGGTVWLDNEPAPVALRRVRLVGDSLVEFETGLPQARTWSAVVRRDVLSGVAVSDSGVLHPLRGARLRPEAEYYPVLPQFTVRQMVVGRRDSVSTIPGRWAGAAREAQAADAARYVTLVESAGLKAFRGAELRTLSAGRVGGAVRRDELERAVSRTLAAIEAQIPDPATRTRFNRMFRPRGTWLVDSRDVAQALATATNPGLRPGATIAALRAIGWAGATSDTSEAALLEQLRRLRAYVASDSSFGRALSTDLVRAPGESADAVAVYLSAFAAAEDWHSAALGFLLEANWIGGAGPSSVAGLIRQRWGPISVPDRAPPIRTRHFGYPQAVPRYGVPDRTFDALVVQENWSAERWIERHGRAAFLVSLRLLPFDFGDGATVDIGAETLTLTTVSRQAEARDNGFLEPADAIEVDPGYVPLLALGAVIHEWQHLIFERVRRVAEPPTASQRHVTLVGADPFVAEGVAEWQTTRLLDKLATRFPLLAMGEFEKRARLAAGNPSEPHVLGYALVATLAAALPEDEVIPAIFSAASDPSALLSTYPTLRGRWDEWRTRPDIMITTAGRRLLIPQMTVTLEDGFPDLLTLRILDEVR